MDDEFYFYCEVCHKKFSADPQTILECDICYKVLDDNGDEVPQDSKEFEAAVKDAEKDPAIKPFTKSNICMCLECQDKFSLD